jgi:hypothetical protein
MTGYRTVQIGLIVDGAGVHDGFAGASYHSIQVIEGK